MASQKVSFHPSFTLYDYLARSAGPKASTNIGGSAAPALSLQDLISLSTEPEQTRRIFTDSLLSQHLASGFNEGSPALRAAIASTYASTSNVTADNVMIANAATGANHVVERSILSPGDHVIVQYPVYGYCVEEPLAIGCTLSFLRCDPQNGWRLSADELKSLVRPGKTKMILLNNPGNPTGSYVDSETQRAIIRIAKEYDLVIHCDEIFRPLFHEPASQAEMPPSFIEHPDLGYDKIVVTSSLSKCYGLSGVRIGWITTRSKSLYEQFFSYRMFSVFGLSVLDEVIATEALSVRCRPAIVQKHLDMAKRNLDLIDKFVAKYSDRVVGWIRPTAGAVGFLKFLDPKTGKGRDDVEFCAQLLKKKGVLLTPGSSCFGFKVEEGQDVDEFKGYVRTHFTCSTAALETGLKEVADFLEGEEARG